MNPTMPSDSHLAFPAGGAIAVRRARCRAHGSDGRDGPVRYRVLDALDRIDPDTGLPRSAILVVRHLRGALTGSPARLSGVDLASVACRAHRAAGTSIPLDCAAVVFADEAELLVCLATDVSAGRSLGWWWPALLGRGTTSGSAVPLLPSVAVARAFTGFARALPAAAAMAPRPVAEAAALLPAAEALRVLALMAEAHAAPLLVEVARQAWAEAGEGTPTGSGSPPRTPPGAGYAPNMRATDGPHVACILDVAVRLHRDPAGARTVSSAEALLQSILRAWWGGPTDVLPVIPDADAISSAVGDATTPHLPAPSAEQSGRSVHETPAGDEDGGTTAPLAHDETSAPGEGGVRTGPVPDHSRGRDRRDEPRRVTTVLGGTFYLLHLLDAVDLPDLPDLRAASGGPGESASWPSRWHVLALVLEAWACDPADVLHELLAELGGEIPSSLRSPDTRHWAAGVAALLDTELARVELDRSIVDVPATIELTEVTVRVLMRLDDINLRVRIAGLDRDPGWVPTLGRIVELVFL